MSASRSAVLLFVAANADDDRPIRADRELREIQDRLARAPIRDVFRVISRPAARPSDLVDAINDERPAIVHFSGHGGADGIVFEDECGSAQEVPAASLADLMATVRDEVRCLVLNACETVPHATAAAEHVDTVIGMQGSIDDKAAATFSAELYRSLASGRSIQSAYEQAIAMMAMRGVGDEEMPRLFARAGVDAASIVFADRSGSRSGAVKLTITIEASLPDLDPLAIGKIMGDLRKLSGDDMLEVIERRSGSVKLDVLVSEAGAARLSTMRRSGGLDAIRGYRVSALDLPSTALQEPVATGGPEWRDVEEPFLDQLAAMGWRVITGSVDFPSVTGRGSFREVLIAGDLRDAIRRINLRDGDPWLDEARVARAVSAIERIGARELIEANQEATELLLSGVTVEGLPEWEGGREQRVHFVDWDDDEKNRFTAVSQFKVLCPGGQSHGSIRPDITLFVNGIPVVVVECKSPTIPEPIAEAVDQLRRYHNARRRAGEVEEDEGSERLFYTNQFMVATSYDDARVGTLDGRLADYLEWKDTAPVPLDAVAEELGKNTLSSQNKLVAGMLRPAHLLDILRHFTIFKRDGGKTTKVVGRYQQFRAVQFAVDRLLNGKTRREDGEHDRRGGIVWHTQGSGKSLTMVFLVRKMRSIPALRRFKIVVVTDRKDLERQLSGTAALAGERVERARRVREVKTLLRRKGPGFVFAMIQKYTDRDLETLGPDDEVGDLGLLNDDDAILVMVDEAHRSHASALHANLLQAMPNCTRIGFTGTPIIMGEKKRTHEIFGEFIDRYTIKQSEEDGATVPILYEGRTAEGAVADGRDLDQLFEDLFDEPDDETLEAVQKKYATRAMVLEAEKLIAAKARDMLRHFVENILPNGLKAQVVAVSRAAAVKYQAAFVEARDELVAEAMELDGAVRALDDLELETKPAKVRAAVRAWREIDRLRALEFAAVISPKQNDPGAWAEWSDGAKIESRIARFKLPLPGAGVEGDPLAFLIVKSMLLTGFDAPIEGVMYLDRPIREAELLQAIARVNRTARGKTAGILVDYYGLAHHLKEALSAYSAEDIDGVLQSLKDEVPKLRDRHERVMGIFRVRGVDPIADAEAAVLLLTDERLRAEFAAKLKQFLATLDLVLPRPEGLPFVRDAQKLGEIYQRARTRYRDGAPDLGKDIGRKVSALIDEHIISLGIDPRIPPIEITDAKFAEHVGRGVSERAKASEMEHAIRSHIRKKLDEDPVHYRKLSERLEEILRQFGEDWEQLALALRDFVDVVTKGRQKTDDGLDLDPALHAPFFDLLRQEAPEHDRKRLAELAVALVERLIRSEIRVVGFWQNATRQGELRSRIVLFLDENGIVDIEPAEAVADQLMELAKANHDKLARPA